MTGFNLTGWNGSSDSTSLNFNLGSMTTPVDWYADVSRTFFTHDISSFPFPPAVAHSRRVSWRTRAAVSRGGCEWSFDNAQCDVTACQERLGRLTQLRCNNIEINSHRCQAEKERFLNIRFGRFKLRLHVLWIVPVSFLFFFTLLNPILISNTNLPS